MKLLFVLLAAAFFVTVYCEESATPDADPEKSEVEKAIAKCAVENKVTEEWVHDAMVKKTASDLTPDQKNFATCVVKNLALMNEDGSLGKKFTDNKLTEKCNVSAGEDQNETAVKIIECLVASEPAKAAE